MKVDVKETYFQMRALVRVCFIKTNTWREVAIGAIGITLAPLVVFICILSNSSFRKQS